MINRMTIEAMKKSEAMHTIDGPVGVSKMYAAFNPKMAEEIPIRDAATAIISGVETIERAEAAGMINMAIISKTPTTLIPTATTIARDIVRMKVSFFGLIPLADAKSSFNVTSKSGDQRQNMRPKIMEVPSQI